MLDIISTLRDVTTSYIICINVYSVSSYKILYSLLVPMAQQLSLSKPNENFHRAANCSVTFYKKLL